MEPGNPPVYVLKEGTERTTGRDAKNNNIMAARAIANAIKTTLGPKGMDKMLVDGTGDVVITNDGAAILKEVDVEHPAAKMLIEVAKAQDEQCGDGTTTSVILAGEMLAEAEALLEQGLHGGTIVRGYQQAAEHAIEVLDDIAKPIPASGRRKRLEQVAATSLGGKATEGASEHLSSLVADAVSAVAETRGDDTVVDLDLVQIQKAQGGTVEDTELIRGVILDKERVHNAMPTRVEDAKIALLNVALEIKKTEVDAKIELTDAAQMQSFLDQEETTLRGMVERLHELGANVVVCQKGIDDLVQHYLAKHGIYAVRRAKKSDLEKLAKATKAKIVNSLDEMSKSDLGSTGVVEERKVGDDKFTFVTECTNPKSVSLLLRGGTEHVVAELERAMHDALSVARVSMEEATIIPGGGATAVEIAMRLRDFAPSVGGREQMAVEAFAEAMESIPRTLAENAGFDEIDAIMALRKEHKKGKVGMGFDVVTGKPSDMFRNQVVEPLAVGRQAIQSATEAATMILRIDDVIASKGGGDDGGAGGMPPGMGGGMPPGMGGGMPMM